MAATIREKRYSTDIGKDSDHLIDKLKLLSGNKKLTKKQIIYLSLEFCYNMKLNLSENPEKPICQKDLDRMKNDIIKHIQGYNDDISFYVKITNKLIKSL